MADPLVAESLQTMHHEMDHTMQSPNGDLITGNNGVNIGVDVDDVLGKKLLLQKVRTFSMLDAAATMQLGKYIEDEEALHSSLESSISESSLRASLLSSSGSIPLPPHSKNIVLDPESNSTVFQAAVSSGAEAVEVVAEQSWLVTKLAVQLLWALRMSKRWILCTLRLIVFVLLLLFPIVKVAVYWFVNDDVHKNIIYGLNGRNLLDVYTVPQTATFGASSVDGYITRLTVVPEPSAAVSLFAAMAALLARARPRPASS